VLIIVRHGRTAANAAGELLGRRDPPLDDLGLIQATRIAASIDSPARIISSPLQRCSQTARAIQESSGSEVEIETDDRLVEIDYGTLEGIPVGQVSKETWARWRADPNWSPGGAESLADVSLRVAAVLDELRLADTSEGAVVLVTHVSPIKAAIGWSLGMGPDIAWRCHVAQASIHRLDIAGDIPRLLEFNSTSHL